MSDSLILAKGREGIPRKLLTFLESLPVDKAWEVTVRPYRRKRSDAQNAALWGYAYKVLGEFMGLHGDEDMQLLHRQMCELYFGSVEKMVLGKPVVLPRRTTTRDEFGKRSVLTTTEWMDFFAFVQRKAAELGVFIDDPSLDHYLQDEKEKAA